MSSAIPTCSPLPLATSQFPAEEAKMPSDPSDADRPSSAGGAVDNFSTIRRNCERHLLRLERYKKARSFCSLEQSAAEQGNGTGRDEEAEVGTELDGQIGPEETRFEELRTKMLALMENDMQLLAKLLQLGETLRELRSTQRPEADDGTGEKQAEEQALTQRAGDGDEGTDEFRPMVRQRQRRRAPLPPEFGSAGGPRAVTHLYVEGGAQEGEEADGDEEEELRPNVHYFSRKNSVLRIPIPPRASNRAFAHCPMKQQRRHCSRSSGSANGTNEDKKTQNQGGKAGCSSLEAADLDSGHSSASMSDQEPHTTLPTTTTPRTSTRTRHSPPSSGQHSPPGTTTTLSSSSSRFSTFSSSLSTASSSTRSASATAAAALDCKRAKSAERHQQQTARPKKKSGETPN